MRTRKGNRMSEAVRSIHTSGDVGELLRVPRARARDAGVPMRPMDHRKGSRQGEGVMTLKQAYSEECHVRSKT